MSEGVGDIAYNFVFADAGNISAPDAIAQSKNMMDGHKFFGLALLCILTLGIGFFWLAPYWLVCEAAFYEALKAEENGEVDVADHLLVPELD